jgi:hypothetical protein
VLTIDGVDWDVTPKITRKAEMKASEISGFMLDKSYRNDVMGTYLSYEIEIGIPFWSVKSYDDLYEVLTDPVDGHSIVVPYNQGTITITGRIEVVQDVYVRKPGGGNYWRETTFTVTANHPTKEFSLGEMLTRGRAPLPELSSGTIGDAWIYTSSGWVHEHYADADDMYF